MSTINQKLLFSPHKVGKLHLNNRFVMAPMTRSRAINNIPNALMATYYGQRASAGLIITEGTAPSPNGIGYARIPGIYSKDQIKGWKLVTDAVHQKGGKIFLQLMHTGRVSHPLNMPKGSQVLAPSAIPPSSPMWTDAEGMKALPTPKAMDAADIDTAIQEHKTAAENAIDAGFDGVELHGANGYLIEQFLNPAANQRKDKYGGSSENRNRFLLETAEKVAEAIGPDKLGIRISPYSTFNDMAVYENIDTAYQHLASSINTLGVAYLHLANNSAPENAANFMSLLQKIRKAYHGTLILTGGFTAEKAEQALAEGRADLVAFGRPFIANPDLPFRIEKSLSLQDFDPDTLYTGNEKGYIDYPSIEMASV